VSDEATETNANDSIISDEDTGGHTDDSAPDPGYAEPEPVNDEVKEE
jgi:hypothetical protein